MLLNQKDKLRCSPDPNLNCGSGVPVKVGLEVVAKEKLRPLSRLGARKLNDGMLLGVEVGIVGTASSVEAGIAGGSGKAFRDVELETGALKATSAGHEVKAGADGVLDESFRGVELETGTLLTASQLFSVALKLKLEIRSIKHKKRNIQETVVVLTDPSSWSLPIEVANGKTLL